ncbi:hypothetical protein LguiA_015040 [Lonicera macranthoides]
MEPDYALSNGELPTSSQPDPVRSREEEDQRIRSNKKVKNKRLRVDEGSIMLNDSDTDDHTEQTKAAQNEPMVAGKDGGIKTPLSFSDVKNDLPKEVYFNENVEKWASEMADCRMTEPHDLDLNREIEVEDKIVNDTTVGDIIDPMSMEWNTTSIDHLIPNFCKNDIINTPLPQCSMNEDTPSWSKGSEAFYGLGLKRAKLDSHRSLEKIRDIPQH